MRLDFSRDLADRPPNRPQLRAETTKTPPQELSLSAAAQAAVSAAP